jgi:hypothetical protein
MIDFNDCFPTVEEGRRQIVLVELVLRRIRLAIGAPADVAASHETQIEKSKALEALEQTPQRKINSLGGLGAKASLTSPSR